MRGSCSCTFFVDPDVPVFEALAAEATEAEVGVALAGAIEDFFTIEGPGTDADVGVLLCGAGAPDPDAPVGVLFEGEPVGESVVIAKTKPRSKDAKRQRANA